MERLYYTLKHPSKGLLVAVSISIALVLWLVLKLNLKYEATLSFPCKITQVPDKVILPSSVLSPISFVVEGKGTHLLRYYFSFSSDTLVLRYERDFLNGYIVINQYIKQLEANPELKELKVQYIKQDTFFLSSPNYKSKKVPIVIKGNIPLSPECRFSSPHKLQPDSVTLIGSEQAIQPFKEWETVFFETSPLQAFTDKIIPLRSFSGIKTNFDKVMVRFHATPYTQINLNISLNIKDLPLNSEVKWTTPSLEVMVMLPLSAYETIQKENYVLSFPFSALKEEQVLVPDFSFLPPEVKVIDYAPKEIKYVIVKKN